MRLNERLHQLLEQLEESTPLAREFYVEQLLGEIRSEAIRDGRDIQRADDCGRLLRWAKQFQTDASDESLDKASRAMHARSAVEFAYAFEIINAEREPPPHALTAEEDAIVAAAVKNGWDEG